MQDAVVVTWAFWFAVALGAVHAKASLFFYRKGKEDTMRAVSVELSKSALYVDVIIHGDGKALQEIRIVNNTKEREKHGQHS